MRVSEGVCLYSRLTPHPPRLVLFKCFETMSREWGRKREGKVAINFFYSKMREPGAVGGLRRLLKIPRMKPKHPVYESIKRATDAKPKAVSKASELASVDAEKKS